MASTLLFASAGNAAATLAPAPIISYERAFAEAVFVITGDVVAYDARDGATLRVTRVRRGRDIASADLVTLGGSAGFSFLARLPRGVTAFASRRDGTVLSLLAPPTAGGLVWDAPGVVDAIASAHADPEAALAADAVRERLAGAWYLLRAGAAGVPGDALDGVVESAAWGLAQPPHATNQAAVDVMSALGHDLQSLGIAYHPAFKPAPKAQAAQALRAWWASRR